ncbi:MAG TPA: GWxTD domain-containing protein [Bacteroidota bacterium]|nr:GWxTD domain-containing protein [Bacteroidota bacterium]
MNIPIAPALNIMILSLFAFAEGSLARAQDAATNPPDSLALAGKELHRGNTARAKELYKWVLKHDRKSNLARMGLGKVAIEESDWGEGCDQFQDVIDSDTGSVAARYYCGICRREYGTQLAWIMRRGQWEKSQVNFLWVLARDSSYEDVLYQLALLYRYRDEIEPALDMARLQVERRPDLNTAALGLFKLYKYAVAVVSPGDIFHLLGRRHDLYAVYFAAEALRRQKRFDEAERFLREVLGHTGTVPVQAIYVSLARISFARGKPAEGEAYYWQAVDHITSWLGSAILFEEIKYIVTDGELKAYNAIASDRKKALFFHLFWNLRNPSPAAKTNVRLAEHERRILRAEHDFEYYGFRSHFNDPDKLHYLNFPKAFYLNQEFNDKGLIYIRHGEPDDIQRTIGDELNESWLYNEKEDSPKRVFYFTQSNSAGNNWRLTSFPEDPAMWENLVMWDHRYNRLLNGQALEQAELQDALRQESTTIVAAGLASDENTWRKETKVFYMPHSVNAFRAEGGKTLLNVAYALPLGEIAKEAADTLKAFRVEVGISLNRADGEVISSNLDTLAFPAGPGAAGSFVELYRFELPPDSVRIAMHARPLEASMVSTWDSRVRVPGFPGTLPMLSDVEFLLPSNAKSSIEIDGVKVIASPFDAVPGDRPLFVYWQMYNLTKDIAGKTAYHSRVLLTPGEAGPGDGSTVVYEKDHTGQDESASELARIDVHALGKGLYTLTVEVTDRKMVRTFSGSRLVRLTGD